MSDDAPRLRGYIGSRPYDGERTPQHVQNLVIRDYCRRHDATYLLSATEYAIPNCFIMLNTVLAELPKLDGIVMYSLAMMPKSAKSRQRIYSALKSNDATLHFAVENQSIRDENDIQALEEVLELMSVVTAQNTI